MDDREKRLPNWVQEELRQLRFRLQSQGEVLTKEVAKLRNENIFLDRKYAALMELITCAAKGGHRTSEEIIQVLDSYNLTVTKDKES
jgi:hypothetical protein